ncbi:MAG: sigma-54-dependent transcriptional regulator [bacterium]
MPLKSPRILIVDDEPLMSNMLNEALKKKNYDVSIADNGRAAIELLKKVKFDLVITDIFLPDINGMDILKKVKQLDANIGVIMITGHGSIEKAVEAMKVGAYDFLSKGFSIGEIEVTVEKFFKYQRLLQENELLRSELGCRYGLERIIGKSDSIRKVFETIEMVAPTKATVLIQGASGTGKELFARAIHDCSPRREQAFVKTNCAAIPEGLIESELFGHEKGAFTGAIRRTKGKFELADGGSLLLDEISEIRPNLQAKLLRVLQEREFEKIGNPESIQVDVRIIATTNRDLREEVKRGNFREDLFYRLNVVPIFVPPLRDRKEDIPLLVDHFIAKYSKENDRRIACIDEQALHALLQHDWPGNVRELENAIERAIVICKNDTILPQHLAVGEFCRQESGSNSTYSLPSGKTLKEVERELILKILDEQGKNRTHAARKLGISVRTLRNKLREYKGDDSASREELVGN